MQNDTKNDKLKIIISELTEESQKISERHSLYSKDLSQNKRALFFADGKNKKELAKSYYLYASLLAEVVSDMERSLSTLPDVILDADKNGQQDRVILCDTLLTGYGEFKKAISLFISQNERLLAGNNATLSEMRNLLSEFGYKLSCFKNFLSEQKL